MNCNRFNANVRTNCSCTSVSVRSVGWVLASLPLTSPSSLIYLQSIFHSLEKMREIHVHLTFICGICNLHLPTLSLLLASQAICLIYCNKEIVWQITLDNWYSNKCAKYLPNALFFQDNWMNGMRVCVRLKSNRG